MIYTQEQIQEQKLEMISQTDFIKKYHPELTKPAIRYAVEKGNVDSIKIGNATLVVLTLHTLNYKPIKHPKRNGNR